MVLAEEALRVSLINILRPDGAANQALLATTLIPPIGSLLPRDQTEPRRNANEVQVPRRNILALNQI